MLACHVERLRIAPVYRTEPVSSVPQPPFLNTAVTGRTRLSPEALLALAKAIEQRAGRSPGPRGGPRPLDIDLLVYGDLFSERPELRVPHARLRQRRFVLQPLADIAAGMRIPPDERAVAELLEQLPAGNGVERVA